VVIVSLMGAATFLARRRREFRTLLFFSFVTIAFVAMAIA
jgi:hypothetical protein